MIVVFCFALIFRDYCTGYFYCVLADFVVVPMATCVFAAKFISGLVPYFRHADHVTPLCLQKLALNFFDTWRLLSRHSSLAN
jgi:hypothetical protein